MFKRIFFLRSLFWISSTVHFYGDTFASKNSRLVYLDPGKTSKGVLLRKRCQWRRRRRRWWWRRLSCMSSTEHATLSVKNPNIYLSSEHSVRLSIANMHSFGTLLINVRVSMTLLLSRPLTHFFCVISRQSVFQLRRGEIRWVCTSLIRTSWNASEEKKKKKEKKNNFLRFPRIWSDGRRRRINFFFMSALCFSS